MLVTPEEIDLIYQIKGSDGTGGVLVVDDQVDIRRMLCVALGRAFQVVEAGDGAAALAAMYRYQPRIVLLDVMMPGEIDGLQVLDAIKSDPQCQHIKVAMISARGQVTDTEFASAHGADAYFIKPFSPTQVATWVRSHFS